MNNTHAYKLARELAGRDREKLIETFQATSDDAFFKEALGKCRRLCPKVDDANNTVSWHLDGDDEPCIEVTDSTYSGKCVRALKDVPAGTLLPFLGYVGTEAFDDSPYYAITVSKGDNGKVDVDPSPLAEGRVAKKNAFIGGRMNEPPMDPMHLFNHIYARINQENVKPYQSMVWDVLKSSFSALPVGLGTMLDEKDCTDEKIETFLRGAIHADNHAEAKRLLERYKNFGFLWDDKSQDIVREKVAWPTREDLRKLIPSDQTMMPCEKVYRHGACVVQMDKPNSRYRVGYLRRVVINDEKSLDIVNTLQVADTFHNVKYVENFVPKTGTFNDFFLDFDRDDNIAEIVVRTRWEKVKFPADYKNDIDDICVGSLLPGGTKLYGRAESILAKYLPNTIVVGATEDLNKAYDCDVSKVFKETAAVPKTVHAYAYIFKDIAPGEELYLNYYYGGRDERRQTAWVNGLDKKSDVYKYLLEDGEVDGIKFKDYWGMPVHDVLSNRFFKADGGTYLRGQKGWLRKKKSALCRKLTPRKMWAPSQIRTKTRKRRRPD